MANLTVHHLRRCHEQARRFLAQLATLLDSLGENTQWTAERRETFRQITRIFEDELCLMVRKEDLLLYPALQGLFPADSGPLLVLRDEHRDLCLSFRKQVEIEQTLRLGDNPPEAMAGFEHFGRKAIEVCQDHLYKEERVLFPMVARFLTPERDQELVRQMENFSET